jgi:hypothetical protein
MRRLLPPTKQSLTVAKLSSRYLPFLHHIDAGLKPVGNSASGSDLLIQPIQGTASVGRVPGDGVARRLAKLTGRALID